MNLASARTPYGRYQRANMLQIVPVLLVVFAIGSGWLWLGCYCAIMLFGFVNKMLASGDTRHAASAPATGTGS